MAKAFAGIADAGLTGEVIVVHDGSVDASISVARSAGRPGGRRTCAGRIATRLRKRLPDRIRGGAGVLPGRWHTTSCTTSSRCAT
ncbi:hypothetical protein FDG2_1067 [Candidatus Protofrankia californiensis]|uniref:Uncharacterized protein n=1 Tax=Candidatus Protofrankia californiensis TaxID=1839754 RepID=A0A1C3NV12_9ACTN|nr:hypothetical protein FDG2_1067 [Candidatus Protofrankia californiensis]